MFYTIITNFNFKWRIQALDKFKIEANFSRFQRWGPMLLKKKVYAVWPQGLMDAKKKFKRELKYNFIDQSIFWNYFHLLILFVSRSKQFSPSSTKTATEFWVSKSSGKCSTRILLLQHQNSSEHLQQTKKKWKDTLSSTTTENRFKSVKI